MTRFSRLSRRALLLGLGRLARLLARKEEGEALFKPVAPPAPTRTAGRGGCVCIVDPHECLDCTGESFNTCPHIKAVRRIWGQMRIFAWSV